MNSPKNKSAKILVLLTCALFLFCSICLVSAQSGTEINASASAIQPQVSSTLKVTITISNVQNLAGIDTTLTWNPSVLTLTNSALNLGDSQSSGVLHGSHITTDENNVNSGDIFVQETKVSGSYQLVAQSIGASNPGFTGSGTIVTLTFNVVGTGSAGLDLTSELADHPQSGQTANNIDHQDTASSVTAIAQGATAAPSPSVPEFTGLIVLAALVVAASAVIVLSAKRFRKS
jgi:hypothetical protein